MTPAGLKAWSRAVRAEQAGAACWAGEVDGEEKPDELEVLFSHVYEFLSHMIQSYVL